ncbi:M15 family metallopeptidase [Streptosporangium sp. NPDC000239]|uniref:M15 family metallopeptidase n=1 Tax=Streptosporangium jomthongense TaxID=1193683 RepID=A0ABV8F6Y3_9ACTN
MRSIQATLAVATACLTTGLATACGTTTAQRPASGSPVSQTSAADETAQKTVQETAPPAPGSTPSRTAPPKFSATVSKVTREQVKHSWRPGCPVPLDGLRMITMTYWGFDDKPHTGKLVVNKDATEAITKVFGRLYDWRWPIYKMEPVDAYKGDDFDSIDANNTSAFNCRAATGSSHWSQHAYGRAVDINPRENPYVSADGSVAHKNARKFAKRPVDAPGVVNPGDRVVKAFARVGWGWGGDWSGIKDYQHFSAGGN